MPEFLELYILNFNFPQYLNDRPTFLISGPPNSPFPRFFASYIIFLGILAYEIVGLDHRNMETFGCYLSIIELMILLYVVGYIKSLWMMIRAAGVKLFFNDIWNGYGTRGLRLFRPNVFVKCIPSNYSCTVNSRSNGFQGTNHSFLL